MSLWSLRMQQKLQSSISLICLLKTDGFYIVPDNLSRMSMGQVQSYLDTPNSLQPCLKDLPQVIKY